jgi:hypothetical protein
MATRHRPHSANPCGAQRSGPQSDDMRYGAVQRVRVMSSYSELRSVVCATVKMMKAHIQCGLHTPRTGTRSSLRLTRGDSRLSLSDAV